MGLWDWLIGNDSGSSSDPTVTNVSSPEQQRMFDWMKPMMQNIGNRQPGQRLWDIPPAPSAVPYMQNVDPSVLAPTGDWYNNLDPNIRQGIEQPFQQGADMLGEQLQNYGGASARGGVSGNMAAGLGNYWAQAAPQMGMQGWNMMQPSNMATYNQNLQAGQSDYSSGMEQWRAGNQESQFPYQMAPEMMGGTYSTPVVQQQNQSNWGDGLMNAMGLGYGMYNMWGGGS